MIHLVYEVRETSKGEKMSDVRTIDIIELDEEVLYDTMDTAIADIKHNWKAFVNDYSAYELISVIAEDDEIEIRYEVDGTPEDEEPEYRETYIPYKRRDFNITYKY